MMIILSQSAAFGAAGGTHKESQVSYMAQEEPSVIMPFPDPAGEGYLLRCSPSGRVLLITDPLAALLGEDLTGRNLNDLLEDRLVARIIAEGQQGSECTFDCRLLGRLFSARSYPQVGGFDVALHPMHSGAHAPIMSVNTSRFLSREINNNLAVMLSLLQRMEREGDRPPEAALFRRSVYRMMRLSRDMEELAAAENGMMEMQFSLEDLTALCRELEGQIRPLLEKQGIRLVCRLPQEPLYCRVDRDKIRRSILHLVSNAVIAQMGQGRMVIHLRTRGEDVLLSVTDCGEGVSGMDFQDIFRKFDRMDPSRTAGTGLGLALVRSFIEKHGGRVVLMSNEGEGASAQITIPWVQDGGSDTVRSGRAAYGTGVDPILVELSNILSAEAFETEGV